ncbi:uncharacterized protein K460DRAFT_157012 [Cucurbitaria berberidis CBS 394.84]|uniref:Uncharacterized protein n=1 Tax=Cucurbitaria berberidis CBS 394.84 TaxID=1168544 RepID=A0A9P4GF40_9PLEO|nr:uncharacterized protein K460DRAFT_157012 [Cucurbitaria berberidis CBS 394.84]KAF1844074.1 hypothetical protein K460DRAFT_157012 [Cucurbitaria berberidis CBS 394.84]
MCLKDESEMPKDLDGALVINEADLDNRTVAIKMEGTDESQAGGQRRCIHWVCVLRNCYYAECQAQGQTEEVAHLATLEVMAQDGDVQASPEGCRQFCNDSDQGMCITLCAPSGIEKSSAGPTPPPQPRNTCEMICMDKMCFLVCLPPHASANIERRSSHSASANIEKRSPLLYCILRCVADMCWVLCSPHSASVNVEKRSHYSVSANVEKRSPIGCIRRCVADMCWLLCSPHSASAKREVEDDVANN